MFACQSISRNGILNWILNQHFLGLINIFFSDYICLVDNVYFELELSVVISLHALLRSSVSIYALAVCMDRHRCLVTVQKLCRCKWNSFIAGCTSAIILLLVGYNWLHRCAGKLFTQALVSVFDCFSSDSSVVININCEI